MKTIACIGDWGYDAIPEYVTKSLQSVDCLFLLGDNFYPSGVESLEDEQWKNKLHEHFPIGKRKYVVLGNHDYLGNVYAQIMYTFCKDYFSWYFPHFFYDEKDKVNDAHYFFIDTALLAPQYTLKMLHACNIDDHYLQIYYFLLDHFATKQREWIIKELERSTSKWKLIMGHYPAISGGKHQISNEIFTFIKDLCTKYSIDYYISGHEHNVQFLQKFNTHFIVSAGLHHTYPVEKIPDTTFCTSESGYIQLEVSPRYILTYVVNEKQKFLVHVNYK
jgi:tartrate-resistant acid phosphatase type 5